MKKLLFEGSEKKMEVFFSPTREPLRNKSGSFWEKLCIKAQAQIVSRFSSSYCDSYILSESSLFIWDHRLLMLTCGSTSLVNALLYLLKNFKQEEIDLFFYQRKNEFFPYHQKTSFMQDFARIKKKTQGKGYCFGAPDEHHFYLFHSESRARRRPRGDRTIEVLMYDLEDHVKQLFYTAQTAKEIKSRLGLDQVFKNAQVDDYIFKPMGYSLNGLAGESQYYTIHVTPQEPGFYVSFETNIVEESIEEITWKAISIFKPLNFDVIVFTGDEGEKCVYRSDSFKRSAYYTSRLECGYKVEFSSFFTHFEQARSAIELE